MRRADATRLVLLAALWGASFLFMRIVAPALGPLIAAEARILLAAAALAIFYRMVRFDSRWRQWWFWRSAWELPPRFSACSTESSSAACRIPNRSGWFPWG